MYRVTLVVTPKSNALQ